MIRFDTISEEDNRVEGEIILRSQLGIYAGKAIVAAERGRKTAKYETLVALAINGLLEFTDEPASQLIIDSIEQRADLEEAPNPLPQFLGRNEQEQQALAISTWETTQFSPGIRPPEDRSYVGHIELIDALASNNAHLRK